LLTRVSYRLVLTAFATLSIVGIAVYSLLFVFGEIRTLLFYIDQVKDCAGRTAFYRQLTPITVIRLTVCIEVTMSV